jgi:hypothetical protein
MFIKTKEVTLNEFVQTMTLKSMLLMHHIGTVIEWAANSSHVKVILTCHLILDDRYKWRHSKL